MKTVGLAALVAALAATALAAHAAEPRIPIETLDLDGLLSVPASPASAPFHARATAVDANDVAAEELYRIAMTEEEALGLAAVEVLAEMKTRRACALLGVVLYANRSPRVRAEAADRLGDIGGEDAVVALALALDSEKDAEVRAVISANLERHLALEAVPATPGTPVAVMAYAG